MRKRLDVVLVERGLAETRAKAQALVLAGRVVGHSKAGEQIDPAATLELVAPPRFVSRGGEKLANALDGLGAEVAGRMCADAGASTGGFTDCLLQAGAAGVVSIDVGHGQLHQRLAADPRVTVLDRTNVRHLAPGDLPYAPELVVCDVSFIGVRLALPPLLDLAAAGWEAVVLVKPQFEVGREHVGKGVVRDPAVHRRVLLDVAAAAQAWGGGCRVVGACDSGLPGPKGNREFFLHLVQGRPPAAQAELEEAADAAVGPGG